MGNIQGITFWANLPNDFSIVCVSDTYRMFIFDMYAFFLIQLFSQT